MQVRTHIRNMIGTWVLVFTFGLLTIAHGESRILKAVDVAPAWSVHRIGSPILLTRDGYQYVGYYDHDRFLTLAQRKLGSDQWDFKRFPVQMGWATGGHAQLSLAVDRDGYIHITSYRRGLLQGPPSPPAAIYYRSEEPHAIGSFERLYMTDKHKRPHYPTLYTVGDTLYFAYRVGGSGRGDQSLTRYDEDNRRWVRALESNLLDGRGRMNAYVVGGGPIGGPDGRMHLLWVWRNTPCHSTNHSLSYARTVGNDLTQWETAGGVAVSPPFTSDDRELLVDDTPPRGGLSNVFREMAWDSKDRVVISFHKFDENGVSQIYNTRFVDGEWQTVAATRWDFIWGRAYFGTGAIGPTRYVRMEAVEQMDNGKLSQSVWNRDDGATTIILDEETLQPIREVSSPPAPAWRQSISQPESDFEVAPKPSLRRDGGPMRVVIIPDDDGSDVEDADYYLRWEHAGTNRDRAVPEPWPEPSMLRVYKISK